MGWDAGLTGSGKPISQVRASGKVSYSVLPKRPLCGGLTNDNPAAINPANFRAGSVLGREPEARGYARPGTDKLDTVEVVMAFEEEFGCEIPDEAAETILTVGDAIKFLEKNTAA